ncbi:MAG: hypothetical protein JXB48_13940, partial [Candidatus Latescibacteria bacterium]|nr:hypothetical protein [Candidatus Latescibacterota bacterium]
MKLLHFILYMLATVFITVGTTAAQIGPKGSSPVIIETDWSPDGKYITYGARYNVWLISVEGGIPVNLTENL